MNTVGPGKSEHTSGLSQGGHLTGLKIHMKEGLLGSMCMYIP